VQTEGPQLDTLTRRLAETPRPFLAEPRIRGRGEVELPAVVADLLLAVGSELPEVAAARSYRPETKGQRNRARLTLIACWVLYDDWFHDQPDLASPMAELLQEALDPLAALIDAERFVADPERREELVRLLLHRLQLRPAGESQPQAADRLKSLDSVERDRLIRESKVREERAKAKRLREEMASRRAREAAAKANREW
jgi:hypothetical protein